jgi:hypothetical protein
MNIQYLVEKQSQYTLPSSRLSRLFMEADTAARKVGEEGLRAHQGAGSRQTQRSGPGWIGSRMVRYFCDRTLVLIVPVLRG